MIKSSIEFPEVETYYILKNAEDQIIPTAYGSVLPVQRLDSGIEFMTTYTDFTEWQTELAKGNVLVDIDDNNAWIPLDSGE